VTNSVPLIAQAYRHAGRTAVVDSQGSFSYSDLLNASSRMATALLAGPRWPSSYTSGTCRRWSRHFSLFAIVSSSF